MDLTMYLKFASRPEPKSHNDAMELDGNYVVLLPEMRLTKLYSTVDVHAEEPSRGEDVQINGLVCLPLSYSKKCNCSMLY